MCSVLRLAFFLMHVLGYKCTPEPSGAAEERDVREPGMMWCTSVWDPNQTHTLHIFAVDNVNKVFPALAIV